MLLACESHFSHHHRSTLSPKKLVSLAKERGHFMIGIADRQSLAGSLEFSKAAIAAGLKPVIGERFRFGDPITSGYITLHVMNAVGWQNLLRLNSCFFNKRKGSLIELEDLAAYADGLFATTGGIEGPIDQAILQNRVETGEKFLKGLVSVFGDQLAVAFDRHLEMGASDTDREALLAQWCLHYRIPGIAISPARHSSEADRVALNVLTFAADGTAKSTIKDPGFPAPPVGSHLKSVDEFEALFAESASLIENTLSVLMLGNFAVIESKPRLPHAPGVADENAAVVTAAQQGLERLFQQNPYMEERRADYEERLRIELGHITKLGFSGYFLIVADFINWSRHNDIPVGPGRGSGAGSLVAWSLGITELDPLRWGLLFERFINPERISLPDFDVDFCERRRDEVLDYVRAKYGADHVAHIAAYNTLKGRGAFKATARAIGIPAGMADSFTKKFPEKGDGLRSFREEQAVKDALADNIELDDAMSIAEQLEGVLDNATKHAAGIVISDEPLPETTPVMGVLDEGRIVPVTQFDMGPIEKTGLVKFDFLGLKTLTVITRTKNILASQGIEIDPYSIPYEDELVFKHLNEGRTQRVFQLESPGMTSALKKIRPNTFEDIVALVSLYRPGPMDQIPLYAERKAGRTSVEYPHPKLEPVLKETYGIMVYQEQIMEAARVLAGYSLGEADVLRRAIGKK
nr:DNA polymerase III subunit alpha [Microvirga tunisiensis]